MPATQTMSKLVNVYVMSIGSTFRHVRKRFVREILTFLFFLQMRSYTAAYTEKDSSKAVCGFPEGGTASSVFCCVDRNLAAVSQPTEIK